MTHLTREELVRWRDQGLAADRDRIVGHLAACGECAAMYAELVRTAPADEPATSLHAGDFVNRGYRARRRGGLVDALAAPLRSWRPLTIAAAGAAAALLLVMLLPDARRRLQSEHIDPEQAGIRGGSLELVAPVGPGSVPAEFRWRSPIEAASYRVDVFDDQGTLMYAIAAATERAAVTAELRGVLTAGARYRWKVTALDDLGAAITSSELQTFVVAPP